MMSESTRPVALIVEDSFLMGMQLKLDVEAIGFTVVGPAANVKSAFELIKEHQLSCAILDVNLGNEDSIPVGRLLMKQKIPFLFITGYKETDVNHEGFEKPIVLRKPVGIDQIRDALTELNPSLPPML